MGDRIIPFLIEDGSYIWNIALKELTNVEPVGEKSSEVLEFWKKWAIENGYKK
jgi:hypothetical protein